MNQLSLTDERNKEQVPFADLSRDRKACGTQIRSDPIGSTNGQSSREAEVLTEHLSESLGDLNGDKRRGRSMNDYDEAGRREMCR